MTRIHMYTHTPHTTHHTHTAAQLDRGWPELWCGRQRLFTQLQERREGSEIEGVNEGELCWGQLPSPPHYLSLPLTPPSLPLPPFTPPPSRPPPTPTPPFPSNPQRCTLPWNMGAHTLKFVWVCVCVCGLVKRQNRAEASNRQTCMWGCHGYGIPVYLCFFFLFNSYFLTVFCYCFFFSFYLSILVLSTKIILSVVLFLFPSLSLSFPSFFLLTSTLVHLSLSLHLLSPVIYVLALVMREAGTQELKFSCKRSCLVKNCVVY